MTVYLNRFLNVPAAHLPKIHKLASSSVSADDPQELLNIMDKQHQVSQAAHWVADYLSHDGDKQALFNTLGHALLREDADFHTFQMYEAAVSEHDYWAKETSSFAELAQQTMILAATRYLAGHAPTSRDLPHTAHIAIRLQRGEKLFDEV